MIFNAFPVSAGRLRGRTVQHGGRRVRGLSFFPFFEHRGRVQRLMYVLDDSAEIYSIPAEAPFPRASLLGRIRIPQDVTFATPICRADLAELARLWHYDPWWVLDGERFAGHWARRQLKQTNCVTHTAKKLITVYYRMDLAQLRWMSYRDESGGVSTSAWDGQQLPVQPSLIASPSMTKTSATWVLDPIWNRR